MNNVAQFEFLEPFWGTLLSRLCRYSDHGMASLDMLYKLAYVNYVRKTDFFTFELDF